MTCQAGLLFNDGRIVEQNQPFHRKQKLQVVHIQSVSDLSNHRWIVY